MSRYMMDRDAVRKEKILADEAKYEDMLIDEAMRALTQHRTGRELLWWLLRIGKAINYQPFTGNALSTSFQCGEVNVGTQILARLIEADPEGYFTLLRERKELDDERQSRLSRADNSDDSDGDASE